MRRVRSDVSHRIRRRTSIFAARWFRGLLVAGLVVIVALLVGPSLVDRMGVELPRGLTPLLPWVGSAQDSRTDAKRPVPTPGPVASAPAAPSTPTPKPPVVTEAAPPRDRTAVEAASTPEPARPIAPAAPVPPAPPSTPSTSRSAAKPSLAGQGPVAAAPRPAPADEAASGTGALTSPPTVYWVQVGAFQDARNAERLVERLRGDGLSAATTTFEQSRVQYRVLLVAPDGTGAVPDDLIERVRGLGFTVETSPDGPAVAGLVALRRAVETSHTLRQQGIRVRLKQEVGSATYRVVRVGSFPTSAEAEATLASLSGRGIEGVIVRER